MNEINARINELFILVQDNIDLYSFAWGCIALCDDSFDDFEDAMIICADTGNQDAIDTLVAEVIL